MLAKDVEHMEQQIAEVAGVERFQAVLVELVELRAAAIGVAFVLHRIEIAGIEPAVLPAVEQAGELARRPALLVEIVFLDQLLEQPQLVVGIDDCIIALEPDQFGMAAQHACADRVERAQPRHSFDRIADMPAHALAHFACGLVGEGDAEDLAGPCAARCDEMCQPCGERRGLAGPRSGQHQHRPFGGQNGLALGRVQPRCIGGKLRILGRVGRGGEIGHEGSEQLGNAGSQDKPRAQASTGTDNPFAA